MMKLTIKEIAAAAGVSQAAVSITLNNREGISREKRELILSIAKDLGYLGTKKNVNTSIKFLVYKRSEDIVVLDDPFASSLIQGIESECRKHSYELSINQILVKDSDTPASLDELELKKSSGLLLFATEMYAHDLEAFKKLDMPIVVVDNYFKNENFDYVLINNTGAGYKVANYLMENGHKDIGFLDSSVDTMNNIYYRKLGFMEALNEKGLSLNKQHLHELRPTLEGSYRDMKRILEDKSFSLPTAYYAGNDWIALGALKALNEKGIKVPETVSLVGMDDQPYCEISYPPLTTVRVFKKEIGEIAVRRLLEKIRQPNSVSQKTEVETELVIRKSVLNITGP